jgi:hypothetical protein
MIVWRAGTASSRTKVRGGSTSSSILPPGVRPTSSVGPPAELGAEGGVRAIRVRPQKDAEVLRDGVLMPSRRSLVVVGFHCWRLFPQIDPGSASTSSS